MFDHTRLFISVFSNMLCHYIFHADAFLHCFDIKLISKEVKFMGLIYRMIQIAFFFFFQNCILCLVGHVIFLLDSVCHCKEFFYDVLKYAFVCTVFHMEVESKCTT